ncbi:MAG: hypothetical protein INR71_00075 [Terriglobus roseus]|nr:hypothetical protein [Terriglobus roseus]
MDGRLYARLAWSVPGGRTIDERAAAGGLSRRGRGRISSQCTVPSTRSGAQGDEQRLDGTRDVAGRCVYGQVPPHREDEEHSRRQRGSGPPSN